MSHRAHGTGAGHPHSDATGVLADLLDLDSQLLGAWLGEATAWIDLHLTAPPRSIVDLGAGTGAGSVALARQFPTARVVAVDRAQTMLDRTDQAVLAAGLTGRVRGVLTDLGTAWPDIADVDLLWASSSLHELPDPAGAMVQAFEALSPGGLLVVVELDSLPRFLPDVALERRVHDVLRDKGWNHHPDWTADLERAGFHLAGRRGLLAASSAPGAGTYADSYLRQVRPAVQGALPAEDLAALDRLLDQDSADSFLRRTGLTVRSSRTAWAARRPTARERG